MAVALIPPPITQPSSPVSNPAQGQVSLHNWNPGPRYLGMDYIFTITKTAPTAGFTSAIISDVCALLDIRVNTVSKRQHTAYELDKIQSAWDSRLSIKQYDGIGNDLITAVADVVAGGNTTRTTTFVVTLNLAEPTRSTYQMRDFFAWPTSWNNAAVGKFPANYTVNIQTAITIAPASAVYTTANPVVRAEELIDTVQGLLNADGSPQMFITHFYRDQVPYASTSPVLRDWPYTGGGLEQISFFCQAGDDITQIVVKADNAVKVTTSKNANDTKNVRWGWSSSYPAAAGQADILHLAFDFTDDPSDFFPFGAYNVFEVDLTLNQAVAAQKYITAISQVFKDALKA